MEVDNALLSDVKNYLDITWDDDAGDKKLSGMILRGMSAINKKAGTEFDYCDESDPRGLLMIYVMYERAGSLDEFWRNYKNDIISLQISEEVKRFAKMEEQADGII